MHSSLLHFELMYSFSSVDLLFCYFLHPSSKNAPILSLFFPLYLSRLILVFLTCDFVVSLSSSLSSIRIILLPLGSLFNLVVSFYCIIPSLLYSRVLSWKISHPPAALCSKKQTLNSIRRPSLSCRREKLASWRASERGDLVSGNDKDKR